MPPKIEARPFETPVGKASGGYAPIRYDPLRSRQAAKAEQVAEVNAYEHLHSAGSYSDRQSTVSGSLHERQDNYVDAIDLRLQRLQDALREDIHDLAFREPVLNTRKILNDQGFRTEFTKAYGPNEYKALTTWVNQFVNSAQADKTADWLDKALSYTRHGMVANAIGFRASTVEKHGLTAAVKSLGSFVGGGERFFARRMALMLTDHDNQVATAMEKSGEIFTRSLQFDRDYRASVASLLEPEGLRAMAHRFGHFAVAYMDQFTAVPTWHAAYDRALATGIPVRQGGTGQPMTEGQARAYADNVVRAAHGGSTDVARSNLMNSRSESVKLFTQLYQFMNNSYGQASSVVAALRTPGLGKPEVLARAFTQLMMPGLVVGLLRFGWPTKDNWGKWLTLAQADEMVGMLPGGAQLMSMAENMKGAGDVAPTAFVADFMQPFRDAEHAAEGKSPGKWIQDIGNAVGTAFHIAGLGQAGETLQYLNDVRQGNVKPQGAVDATLGTLNGAHRPLH
jgi:hypothetical protein